MNVYFSCSITGGREDQPIYQALVGRLLELGHQVPTALLARADVFEAETVISPEEVFRRDDAWVRGCDALIAEVSTPSHGVGYEIALAVCLGKPVFCCYQEGRSVSKMLLGNRHPQFKIAAYRTTQEALDLVDDFLSNLE
ncbi:MAG: deoxyribonucleoside 5'-monophosphate N-glycosidase [Anaerolineae bacterium]|nr:deoxyribonucleoside 5'-monophosphate N-glycosidase [Anaerolineae bacterium]